jgi:hypothetical protein
MNIYTNLWSFIVSFYNMATMFNASRLYELLSYVTSPGGHIMVTPSQVLFVFMFIVANTNNIVFRLTPPGSIL